MKRQIPNIITCLNVLTGTVGIVCIFDSESAATGLLFVLIAAGFDFLDGLSARLLGVQSEMGKQLDSLADAISFGVLPAISMLFLWREIAPLGNFGLCFGYPIESFFPLLIVPFSVYRLAKFNLATDQSDEFKGLPTPANALMITSLAYFVKELPFSLSTVILICLTIVSCFLLVSNIRMVAFKFKSGGWNGNELRFSLLLILILGFAIFQLSFVPFVIPTYIVVSIVGNYLIRPVLN